jgi:hypothetical protein
MAEDIKITGADAFTTAARSMGDAIQGSSNDIQRFIDNISRLGDVGKGIEGLTKPIGKAAVPIEKLNKLLLSINKLYVGGAAGVKAQTKALTQQIATVNQLNSALGKLSKQQGTGPKAKGPKAKGPNGEEIIPKSGPVKAYDAAMGDLKRTISGTFTQITGLSFSLMSLVALFIKAYNAKRLMSGFGTQAAGQLGGTTKQITAMTKATNSLYYNFLASTDEAGAFVQMLADLGMEADDIAKKSFVKKKFSVDKMDFSKQHSPGAKAREVAAKPVDEMIKEGSVRAEALRLSGRQNTLEYTMLNAKQKLLVEGAKNLRQLGSMEEASKRTFELSKLESAELVRRRKYLSENMDATTELYAMAKVYKVAGEEVARPVATLVQDYGMLNNEARIFVGTALKAGEAMEGVSAKQTLADTMKLIQSTDIYRADLVGVQAVYNSLQRKGATFAGLDIDKMSRTARTGIAQAAANTMNMSLQWKAALGPKLGKGGERLSLLGSAMAFEKMSAPARLMSALKLAKEKAGGGTEDERAGKARLILGKMDGVFPPEALKFLGEMITKQGVTNEALENEAQIWADGQKKVAENNKAWVDGRASLVDSAQAIAWQTRTLEQTVQAELERLMTQYVTPIIAILGEILSWMPGFATPDEQKKHLGIMQEFAGEVPQWAKKLMGLEGMDQVARLVQDRTALVGSEAKAARRKQIEAASTREQLVPLAQFLLEQHKNLPKGAAALGELSKGQIAGSKELESVFVDKARALGFELGNKNIEGVLGMIAAYHKGQAEAGNARSRGGKRGSSVAPPVPSTPVPLGVFAPYLPPTTP